MIPKECLYKDNPKQRLYVILSGTCYAPYISSCNHDLQEEHCFVVRDFEHNFDICLSCTFRVFGLRHKGDGVRPGMTLSDAGREE